jgi:hypothetical protein
MDLSRVANAQVNQAIAMILRGTRMPKLWQTGLKLAFKRLG